MTPTAKQETRTPRCDRLDLQWENATQTTASQSEFTDAYYSILELARQLEIELASRERSLAEAYACIRDADVLIKTAFGEECAWRAQHSAPIAADNKEISK